MKCAQQILSRLHLLILLALLTATGCDLLGGDDEENVVTSGVYVTNQGTFGGSGSLTVYDPATDAVSNPSVLQGLGSIFQSGEIFLDRLHLTANTGGRLDIVDPGTHQRVGQVAGLTGARYTYVFSPAKAYVTGQVSYVPARSRIYVVNPATGAKLDSVEVDGNAENIAVYGSRAYVATGAFGANRSVVVLDTQSDDIVQTLTLDCDAPRYVAADLQGEIFVVCNGNTVYDAQGNVTGKTNGAVVILNSASGQVVKKIDVDAQLGTSGAGQDAYGAPVVQELYVIKEGNRVLRIDTESNSIAAEFGPVEGGSLSAVAYDEVGQRLYLAHTLPDYVTPGTVTIHDRAGAQVGRFTAGIAPAYITFRREAN